jgi:osmotically-inducible protein OsmY
MIAGIMLGAGMAYFLDPDRGRRRRAMARDRAGHMARWARRHMRGQIHYWQNRARGAVAELEARVEGEPVDDEVLEERVRSRLGHIVHHPEGIQVRAQDGGVSLTGYALPEEVDAIIEGVSHVRGVDHVISRIQPRHPDWKPAAASGG